MPKKNTDALTKEYIKNPVVFSDICNQYLHRGKQVIRPEQLREMDTTMITVPSGFTTSGMPVQRYRDTLKILMAMHDNETAYCIAGIESQKEIHYAVPVKNGIYDFIQLSNQVTDISNVHKRNRQRANDPIVRHSQTNDTYQPNSGEYLSGFWKTDRLLPVITIVVYWGNDAWDAPLHLHDMYNTSDETILRYAPDYHVNLISAYGMTDDEINRFRSDMREIMLYIKYSGDAEKLDTLLASNENYRHMRREATDVLNSVTSSKLEYPEGEVEIDMCKAIRDMREQSRTEGRAEGETTGCIEGKYNIKKMLYPN